MESSNGGIDTSGSRRPHPDNQNFSPGAAMLNEDARCHSRASTRWRGSPVFRAVIEQPSSDASPFVFPCDATGFSPSQNQRLPSTAEYGEEFDMDPNFPHLTENAECWEPESSPECSNSETSPKFRYAETVPKCVECEVEPNYSYGETTPKYLFAGNGGYPYVETDPKYVSEETYPKQFGIETNQETNDVDVNHMSVDSQPRFSFPDSEARFSYSSAESGDYPYPLQEESIPSESASRVPKQGSPSIPESTFLEHENNGDIECTSVCCETKLPDQHKFQSAQKQEYRRRFSDQPPCLAHLRARRAGTRRLSDVSGASPGSSSSSAAAAAGRRQRRKMCTSGRSHSEETSAEHDLLLQEQAQMAADQTGRFSITSDMRGTQTTVRDSTNVHVGPRVFDQRAFNVARMNSRVDNLHRHEHVENKHEHIQNKHEHVQNKTEVHNKTENVKHEHIQEKHEHIQVHKTEIVHSKTDAIFTNQVHVHLGCRHETTPPSSPQAFRGNSAASLLSATAADELARAPVRQFADCRRFLETRYTSWTTLSTPLPWYDDMVLDLSKSCVDFSMVSMGSNSTNTFNGVEELVRSQQPEKALRIIVEGHAGYGKTTLAAKVAFDWACGAAYLRQYSHAFLIFLREMTGSLNEHIKAQHYPLELGDEADAFLDYLKTNQDNVLFIFDGYDELPKEGREVIDHIMSGRSFVHSGAIMTSRPMSMTFKKYCQFVSLVGFDDSKKREFVRLVYKDRPLMRIEEFLTVLASDRSVDELAQCPLMCLLLCEMYQRGAFAGRATRSKLYEELFHYLVGKAVHRRQLQSPPEDRSTLVSGYDAAMVKFGEFCLRCLASDKLSFTADQIQKCCKAERLFDIGFLVKCRNLTSYMGSETYYEPIHKTFVEFLAARYLQSLINDEESLKKELMELKQTTSRPSERLVLLYLCGLLKTEAWIIMEQLDIDDANLDFIFTLLRESGETPQNVAAVCRRLPRDVVRGSDKHLTTWALCLSSPASELCSIEFIWDFESSTTAGSPAELVSAQLGFWSALQSCANITDLRVTFFYGHSSEVPADFMEALCECMKHCARLSRLAVLHVKAIAPDSEAETFMPVITSLSQHVRSCASLHRLTVEVILSSSMTKRLCTGLTHVGRLQTLKLPKLHCDAAGFSELARLVRHHASLKTLDVSVFLVDGPVDMTHLSYSQLNRKAMYRNKQVTTDPDSVHKVPLHRAMARTRLTADQAPLRTSPDQELQFLNSVLAVNFKDERRVRVMEGIWCLADRAGARALYPLPMCDRMSHKGGYHALFEVLRQPGARLECLTVGRESLTKMDHVCLGETIRKSESLTQLTVMGVEWVVNLFPLLIALPTASRLESIFMRSNHIQLNDFLFMVLCRCLEHNESLQEIGVQEWKFQLETTSSVDHLRSLMKNTGLKRVHMAECKVALSFRVDESLLSCSGVTTVNLSNCCVETPAGSVRGATFLPHLQGLSQLKQLDLSHNSAATLTDAAVKTFFAGLSGFKTLQELSISGWTYDISNPESAYADTKTSAKKCGRLTKVLIDKSQFSGRSLECRKQWLVQAMATGVPHLQELHLSGLGLMHTKPRRCAITQSQVESLAKAILKAKWTGYALQLFMPQDPRLVDQLVDLTRMSSKIDVASDGRVVMFKRNSSAPWWRLRPR